MHDPLLGTINCEKQCAGLTLLKPEHTRMTALRITAKRMNS